MASIKPPKLSLDDIVIAAKHGKTPGAEPLVLSGSELAHVLSLRARTTTRFIWPTTET